MARQAAIFIPDKCWSCNNRRSEIPFFATGFWRRFQTGYLKRTILLLVFASHRQQVYFVPQVYRAFWQRTTAGARHINFMQS
jgi:hypothetical protein